MIFHTSWAAVPKLVAALSKKFPEQEITYCWADGETMQHLGRMVFRDGEAIGVDIPQEPGALAETMPAGVRRFQTAAEQPPHHGRNPQKKTIHRGRDR